MLHLAVAWASRAARARWNGRVVSGGRWSWWVSCWANSMNRALGPAGPGLSHSRAAVCQELRSVSSELGLNKFWITDATGTMRPHAAIMNFVSNPTNALGLSVIARCGLYAAHGSVFAASVSGPAVGVPHALQAVAARRRCGIRVGV